MADPVTTPNPASPDSAATAVSVGGARLTIEQVIDVAEGRARLALDPSHEVRERLERSHRAVGELRRSGGTLYGVTTGVGASVGNAVPSELHAEMPRNLFRFHGVGTGRLLDETESAAVLVTRAASLARGYSGVRPELIERLCELVNHRLLPCIPSEGSVGASGDLTPLSYVAALLAGEREATLAGEPVEAAEGLASTLR